MWVTIVGWLTLFSHRVIFSRCTWEIVFLLNCCNPAYKNCMQDQSIQIATPAYIVCWHGPDSWQEKEFPIFAFFELCDQFFLSANGPHTSGPAHVCFCPLPCSIAVQNVPAGSRAYCNLKKSTDRKKSFFDTFGPAKAETHLVILSHF